MGVLLLSPTMKSLLVLFVAVGVSQAAVTCDECRAAAQDLVSHMLSEENLAEQVQIMKDNVCPQLGIDGCEAFVDMWYGDMAQEESIAEGVAYLQGECFCGAEGHTEDCPAL